MTKKQYIVVASIFAMAALIFSLTVSYYLLVYLPQKDRKEALQQRVKAELLNLEKEEGLKVSLAEECKKEQFELGKKYPDVAREVWGAVGGFDKAVSGCVRSKLNERNRWRNLEP